MDFVELLANTNKLSIVFFAIALAAIGYEFYLFRRDKKKGTNKPTITAPQFHAATNGPKPSPPPVPKQPQKKGIHVNKNVLGILGALAIFATTGIVAYITVTRNSNEPALPPIGSRAASQEQDAAAKLNDIAQQSGSEQAALVDPPSPTPELLASGEKSTTDPNESGTETLSADDLAQSDNADNNAGLDDSEIASLESDIDSAGATVTIAPTNVPDSVPSPTPIVQLPESSTYQYFFIISIAAATTVLVSLLF